MIDFRYHLISLIAVILALALGIFAGSGFLGGPLLENLEGDVRDLRATNSELRDEVARLTVALEESDTFARLADPYLTAGVLAGQRVAVIQLDGSDGGLLDGVKRALGEAGAEIVSEITLSEKFALPSAPDRDQLALALSSAATDAEELRLEAAVAIGERAAAAAAGLVGEDSPSSPARARLVETLESLERAEFIALGGVGPDGPVPPNARFIIVGGNAAPLGYEPGAMVRTLAIELADRGAATYVVEDQESLWDLVGAIRRDAEARSSVGTVDNGDTTIGHIALVIGLDRAADGTVGHFGFGPGRTGVIPQPTPAP